MKMKFLCDCGADMYISAKSGADEATVRVVADWIRAHSLHGVRLVKKPAPSRQANTAKSNEREILFRKFVL